MRSAAQYFGLTAATADANIKEVATVTAKWRDVAAELGATQK
jgi:hypothetical protein